MFNNQFGYQMPAYQAQPQRNMTLPAMFIDDINQIRPSDVPMNGVPSVFVLKDFSAVYLKQWNGNGQIDTLRLIPEVPIVQPQLSIPANTTGQADILRRLDAIEKLLTDNGFVRKEETV